MFNAKQIAEGFMINSNNLKTVLDGTASFLGRKLDAKEICSILRSYKKYLEREAFYGRKPEGY